MVGHSWFGVSIRLRARASHAGSLRGGLLGAGLGGAGLAAAPRGGVGRSGEQTAEVQSRPHIVCRLLLAKKNAYCDRRTDGAGRPTGQWTAHALDRKAWGHS